MEHNMALRAAAAILLAGLSATSPLRSAAAADSDAPTVDSATLARIRDTAMSSDWAWRELAHRYKWRICSERSRVGANSPAETSLAIK